MKKTLTILLLAIAFGCFGQISVEEYLPISGENAEYSYESITPIHIVATVSIQRFCEIFDSNKQIIYADTIVGNITIINKIMPGAPPIEDYDSMVIWWDLDNKLHQYNLRLGEAVNIRPIY